MSEKFSKVYHELSNSEKIFKWLFSKRQMINSCRLSYSIHEDVLQNLSFFHDQGVSFLLSIHEKDKKDHRYIIYPYKWLIKWDYEVWLVIPLRKTQAACQVLYRFPSILCKFKVYHQRVSQNSILIGKKSIIFLPAL